MVYIHRTNIYSEPREYNSHTQESTRARNRLQIHNSLDPNPSEPDPFKSHLYTQNIQNHPQPPTSNPQIEATTEAVQHHTYTSGVNKPTTRRER